MGHDIREAKGSEKKRSGFELTAAECSKSALVVRTNEDEFELPTVVQENKQFGCNTICGFEGTCLFIFLDSSMVEHSAVNRRVVGSSPTRGAKDSIIWSDLFLLF